MVDELFPRRKQIKRTRKSTGDKVREAAPIDTTGRDFVRTSGVRGKGVSLGIDVKVNHKSYAKTVKSIRMLEKRIHKMGDDRTSSSNPTLTHFAGVYTMMAKMYGRAQVCVPPTITIIKPQVALMFAENFLSNGLPSGGWAPLSPAYGAWKALRFPGKPTMQATGRLFESLTTGLSTDKITDDSVEFGNKVRYSTWHQYGTTKMPMRRLVFERPGFAKAVGSVFAKYVANHGVSGLELR